MYPALVTSDESEYDKPLYDEWLRLISEKNIEATIAQAYQQLSFGDIVMDVLNPPAATLSGTESDTDNNSLVLRVSEGDVSFLVTGDLMREGEHELAYERLLSQTTVLKVAHHGSDTSTTEEFLNVVRPQIAVISVGENNYGHPSPKVVGRLWGGGGTKHFRTDEDGTLEFITDGVGLWLG